MQANHITYALRYHRRLLTLAQVADRCSVHPHFVAHLCRIGLIEPAEGHQDLYLPETTVRIQRILRLRQDLSINFNGIAVILDLIKKIDILEARLRHVKEFS